MINTALYRLAIGAYATGIRAFSLFNPKAKLFVEGRKGLLPKLAQSLSGETRPRIWIHCASLGEFEQGRPVLENIKANHPGYAIVLTFFSPSGYEVRKDYKGADYVFYLPVDSLANADTFLNAVQPKLCLFIKYELWYYYLAGLAERKIPTFLVSAIFDKQQGFFKWYGGLQRKMLGYFTRIFVQDEGSSALLKQIGISSPVLVSGDTRFDRVVKAATEKSALLIMDEFCEGYNVIVAGSTWADDEKMLKQAIESMPANWRLVLVPHNVDAAHIETIVRLYEGNIIKWTEGTGKTTGRVLLVDKVGLLTQLYSYARVAYIGGGFGRAGVHNVLEAAVYGKPCFYGPVFHQFIEAGELVACGGAQVVNNAANLVAAISEINDEAVWFSHATAAQGYVYSKQGATECIMKEIRQYL